MGSSLWKKILAVFGAGLLGFAAIGFELFTDNPLRSALNETTTSNYATLKWASGIRSGLKDIEAAELGFALSGEQIYLIAARDISSQLRRNLRELKKLCASAAGEQRMQRLEPLVDQRIQNTEQIIAARTNGKGRASYALVQTGIGRRLSEEIASALTGIEQDGLMISAYQDRLLERHVKKDISLIAAGYAAHSSSFSAPSLSSAANSRGTAGQTANCWILKSVSGFLPRASRTPPS